MNDPSPKPNPQLYDPAGLEQSEPGLYTPSNITQIAPGLYETKDEPQ